MNDPHVVNVHSFPFHRCKFGQLGPGKGQFNAPHGFCIGQQEDIVVADTNNHRIQVFEKNGEFKYQFGIPGRSRDGRRKDVSHGVSMADFLICGI